MLLQLAGDGIELQDQRAGQTLARPSIVDDLFDNTNGSREESQSDPSQRPDTRIGLTVFLLIALAIFVIVAIAVLNRG